MTTRSSISRRRSSGGLDGLFNVAADLARAGTIGRDSDVMSVPLEVWLHTIDVTLTGDMYGIRHALPILIERGGGAIVKHLVELSVDG